MPALERLKQLETGTSGVPWASLPTSMWSHHLVSPAWLCQGHQTSDMVPQGSKGLCPNREQRQRQRAKQNLNYILLPSLRSHIMPLLSYHIGQGNHKSPSRFKERGCRIHFLMGKWQGHTVAKACGMWIIVMTIFGKYNLSFFKYAILLVPRRPSWFSSYLSNSFFSVSFACYCLLLNL